MKAINGIKAVIFDMDGVIVDSEPLESKALEMVIREYGKEPIYKEHGLIHPIGTGEAGVYANIMKEHGVKEDIEIVRSKKGVFFVEIIKRELKKATPGFIKLIRLLQRKKIRIALATNRRLDHVMVVLERINAAEFFEIVVGPDTHLRHKPEPDIYLETAKQLRLKPSECIAIEDTGVGVESAHAAGVKVIAVPNKFTNHHDFSKADLVIKSLLEVDTNLLNKI